MFPPGFPPRWVEQPLHRTHAPFCRYCSENFAERLRRKEGMPFLTQLWRIAIVVYFCLAVPVKSARSTSVVGGSEPRQYAEIAITKAENAYTAAVKAADAAETAYSAAVKAAGVAEKEEQAAKKDSWTAIRSPQDIFGSFNAEYMESVMKQFTPEELIEVRPKIP